MNIVLVVFVWLLNLGISIWNAYAVGLAWVETKHAGGWRRFMAWMGAIMAASGFTWCYLFLLALLAWWLRWLELRHIEVMFSLGYILIIPGVLFSGLMITIDSWAQAYRQRTLGSFGTAAYNTFAQIHNTYNAVTGMGQAFQNVASFFSGSSRGRSDSDKDDRAGVLIILLVLLALLAGVLTTAAIIHRVAGGGQRIPLDRPPS
jgi:hypothetical protein